MNLERIVGSIVTENGPQPFVLYTMNGRFEVGAFMEPDEAQKELTVIQQQRFVQLIAERAGVAFAQVRLGQYYHARDARWIDVVREGWGLFDVNAPSSGDRAPTPGGPMEDDEERDEVIEAKLEVDEAPADADEASSEEGAWEDREAGEERVDAADEEDEEVQAVEDAMAEADDTADTPLLRAEDRADEEGMLENAIHIAVEAHRGQVDKAGAPYILHPLRMMLQMQTPLEMTAAVLHDVVEDTGWTLDELRREGFSEKVLDAVDSLTRRDDESYDAFIERAARHPVARRVKLADLEDNMDVRRLGDLTPKDLARLARYQQAWHRLQNVEA